MNRLVCSTLVAAAVGVGLGAAAPAWADIAPPRDYVEQCTLERVQGDGDSCVECQGSFQDREACATAWAPQGYEKSCQTRGASVWTEIWCASGEGSADAPQVGDAPAAAGEGSAAAAEEGAVADEGAAAEGGAEEGAEAPSESADEGATDESAAGEESDGDEAQETAPVDPPARSSGCTAAPGTSTWMWALGVVGLAVRRRRR